ncbi:phosphoribosyltransferase [Acetobacteraceae bacterium H6797]|nr:phosphoribosyltransferase [Acetobacteraceae bacterium H6797]
MEFWQAFRPGPGEPAPYDTTYPATMPDGTVLDLPLRDYGDIAVAGFIANQASFTVLRRIAGWMTEAARPLGAEVVVGLPTLGHSFAPLVAEGLGHGNWVAGGYSRKRWYEDRLSVPILSSTTPGERRLYLDPRMLHRLEGRRVLLVDDVISSGSSALAGLALLAAAGIAPVGLAVGMIQGRRWEASWPTGLPVVAAFETPVFQRLPGFGWGRSI